MKIVVKRDTRFEEGRTFRRSHAIDPSVAKDWEREALKAKNIPKSQARGTQSSD